MSRPKTSPKALQRSNVMNAHRARGRGHHGLWLVYSAKTDQHMILTSDREFVHWAVFLEANPQVKTFNIDPELVLSEDDVEIRATVLDAFVYLEDGTVEWHEVKAGSRNKKELSEESQLVAQAAAASLEHAAYKIFNDDDLEPVAQEALRWEKALAYAEVIREYEYTACQIAVTKYLKGRKSGRVEQLVEDNPNFAPELLKGILVRLVSQGLVEIDLSQRSFGKKTIWTYRE